MQWATCIVSNVLHGRSIEQRNEQHNNMRQTRKNNAAASYQDPVKIACENNVCKPPNVSISCLFIYLFLRPLTQEEIAARREQARQRHSEMLVRNAGLENGTPLILEPAFKENKENESGGEREKPTEDKEAPKSHVLAFARVYSGTIRKGQQLYVLGPKHDPRETPSQESVPLDVPDESRADW